VPAAEKDDTKARPDFRSLASFWPYALRYRGRIALALLALVIASAATLALPVEVLDDADLRALINRYDYVITL